MNNRYLLIESTCDGDANAMIPWVRYTDDPAEAYRFINHDLSQWIKIRRLVIDSHLNRTFSTAEGVSTWFLEIKKVQDEDFLEA